jgi:hypothetical protein
LIRTLASLLASVSISTALAAPPTVDQVLDGFHEAAAKADADAYFGAMTPDGVFIGTDVTERWDRAAFEAFAAPHFQRDSAWTYVPRERHVAFGPKGKTAWFDEVLDHARYGTVRGSGVLVKQGKAWKIAHYVLSFPVPNDVAADVVATIQDHERGTATAPSTETPGDGAQP